MKKTAVILTLVFLLTAMSYGQYSKQEIIQIKDSLKQELTDSLAKPANTKKELKSMIRLLNHNLKNDSLFPYQQFDSVVYSQFEDWLMLEPDKMSERKIIKKKTIEQDKVNSLLRLINNPLNFQWGECGTPVREAKVEFWHKGKIMATIDFACSFGQIFCEPENILIRWGVFNEKGNKILDNIGLWE
jgi:hypothetical protein